MSAVARERLEGGRIKGSMIRNRFDWLKTFHPETHEQEIINSLPPATKERFARRVLASEWYEFGDLVALDKSLRERFGKKQPDVIRELGRYAAKMGLVNVGTTFSSMSIHEIFGNSAKMHSRFKDFGQARYEQVAEKAGKMVYSGYPCFSPVFCESTLGFFEESVAAFGGKNLNLSEPLCHCHGDPTCTFTMQWS